MKFVSRRKIVKLLLALVLVLVALLVTALYFPRQILCVDSGPVTAEVIVLLGGGGGERPERAAELFRAGEASRIICTGLGDCNSNMARLLGLGVPAERIRTECKATTTRENAEFTIRLLRQQGVKRVIVVTSWYHSRRALNCFEHYAPELMFYSRPSYFAVAPSDWKPRGIQGYIRMEYWKNLGYWLRYGVSPF